MHCHGAYSRTPTIGVLYGVYVGGASAEDALSDVLAVLSAANPNPGFRAALNRLATWAKPR